jgi:ribulose-5-phosphate 4-epimerase/fuculose-1-phosphate aldolase
MSDVSLREHFARMGRALYNRGYSSGSSGNISVRVADGYLMTPTNSCLGMLDPARISTLDPDGNHISGDKPSKEVIVHLAMYRVRPNVGAVVHLHAPWATAVSCLKNLNPDCALPPLTPYFVMRIGRLPLVPYFRPGDPALAEAVAGGAQTSHAILLAHHGLIVGGQDLDDAVNNAEELEETARLFLVLQDKPYRTLNAEQVAELENGYPKKI